MTEWLSMHKYIQWNTVLCAQTLSCIWLFETPWTVAHQAPLSMGNLQARILEWVPMPSSRGSSQPRDWTQVSHIAGRFFTIRTTREIQEYSEILLNHKKEWNSPTCDNLDELQRYYAKWDKSDGERQIPYDFIHMSNLKRKTQRNK